MFTASVVILNLIQNPRGVTTDVDSSSRAGMTTKVNGLIGDDIIKQKNSPPVSFFIVLDKLYNLMNLINCCVYQKKYISRRLIAPSPFMSFLVL